jgi:hypothetical protein
MISTRQGVGLRRGWFPRVVAERYLRATKDGEIKRSPDPVTTIEGDVSWFNSDPDPQNMALQIIRAPRTVVAQNPNTVVIHDAWAVAVGENPTAEYPQVGQDAVGGSMQIDRPETAEADILYGRFFFDADASQAFIPVGVVQPGQGVHARYLAAVQTPGVWTTPSEFEPRWEAHARWVRLLLHASPVGAQ